MNTVGSKVDDADVPGGKGTAVGDGVVVATLSGVIEDDNNGVKVSVTRKRRPNAVLGQYVPIAGGSAWLWLLKVNPVGNPAKLGPYLGRFSSVLVLEDDSYFGCLCALNFR